MAFCFVPFWAFLEFWMMESVPDRMIERFTGTYL